MFRLLGPSLCFRSFLTLPVLATHVRACMPRARGLVLPARTWRPTEHVFSFLWVRLGFEPSIRPVRFGFDLLLIGKASGFKPGWRRPPTWIGSSAGPPQRWMGETDPIPPRGKEIPKSTFLSLELSRIDGGCEGRRKGYDRETER